MTPRMTKEQEDEIRHQIKLHHKCKYIDDIDYLDHIELLELLISELDATRGELAMIEDSFNRRHHDLDVYIGKLKSENARLKAQLNSNCCQDKE